jgi:hypothetical protein
MMKCHSGAIAVIITHRGDPFSLDQLNASRTQRLLTVGADAGLRGRCF